MITIIYWYQQIELVEYDCIIKLETCAMNSPHQLKYPARLIWDRYPYFLLSKSTCFLGLQTVGFWADFKIYSSTPQSKHIINLELLKNNYPCTYREAR